MSYFSEVLADSPLVYLKLDETSGTTAADSSGNGRNMTSANATLNQPTVMPAGTASYDFNGTTTQVTGAFASWQAPAAFTIEAWIRPDSVSFNAIGAKDGPGVGWALYVVSGVLRFFSNGTGQSGSAPISVGGVYHVVATFASGAINLYVNGVLDATLSGSVTQTTGTGEDLMCGVSTGSNGGASRFFFFDGRMDEWAYYGTALSGTRIAAHYAAGASSPNATVTPPAATATALAPAPVIVVPRSVFPPAATAAATAPVPSISNGGGGNTVAPPAATATATAPAPGLRVLVVADTSNALDGLDITFTGTATLQRPAAAAPSGLVLAEKYDKAIAYPPPVMDNGRPT